MIGGSNSVLTPILVASGSFSGYTRNKLISGIGFKPDIIIVFSSFTVNGSLCYATCFEVVRNDLPGGLGFVSARTNHSGSIAGETGELYIKDIIDDSFKLYCTGSAYTNANTNWIAFKIHPGVLFAKGSVTARQGTVNNIGFTPNLIIFSAAPVFSAGVNYSARPCAFANSNPFIANFDYYHSMITGGDAVVMIKITSIIPDGFTYNSINAGLSAKNWYAFRF